MKRKNRERFKIKAVFIINMYIKKIIILTLIFLIIPNIVSGKTYTLNCTWIIDEAMKDSAIDIHTEYDISGRLIHINNLIKPKINFYPFCMSVIEDMGAGYRVFDYVGTKNNEIVEKEGYITFIKDENLNISVASFPCVNLNSSDIFEMDYYIGGKIKGIHNFSFINAFFNFFGLEISEERYYPFDQYNLSSWASLSSNFYTLHSAKVLLPPSYSFVNESTFTCPLLSKKVIYRIMYNETDNTTQRENLIRLALFTYYSSLEESYFQFKSGEGKNIQIFGDVICSPATKEIKNFITAFGNLTSDFENTRDQRTGKYLFIKFGRPEIMKGLFWFSLMIQMIVGMFVLIFQYKKTLGEKIEKIFIIGFSVWVFQEGINILSPIIRPTILTIFDLTILATITIVIISFPLEFIKFKKEEVKIDSMNLTELKNLAKNMKIRRFDQLSKSELINQIKEKRRFWFYISGDIK